MPHEEQENPDEYNGWTNFETWNVYLWMSNDPRMLEYARELVERCFALADVTAAEHPDAIVSPRADACDALKEWIEADNPLNGTASEYADLLQHAISRVNWYEIVAALREP